MQYKKKLSQSQSRYKNQHLAHRVMCMCVYDTLYLVCTVTHNSSACLIWWMFFTLDVVPERSKKSSLLLGLVVFALHQPENNVV